MSRENVKTIQEIMDASTPDERPDDVPAVFEELWQEQRNMVARIADEMELNLLPESEPYRETRSIDGKAVSKIYTYSGSKIKYMSNCGLFNEELGFANIHINIWVSPEIQVPGFGCVFGNLPALFHYNDFVPRYDLWHQVHHLDDYYTPVNDHYLDFMGRDDINPFLSQDTYIRTCASPVAAGVSLENTQEKRDLVKKFANERLDIWLDWMRNPKKTPPEDVETLANRDYRIQLANAHRDPANPVAFRMFGLERGHRLLEQLWGIKWEDKLYEDEPETEGMTLKPGSRF